MQAFYDKMMTDQEKRQDWQRELSQTEIDQFEALQDTDLGWGDWPA